MPRYAEDQERLIIPSGQVFTFVNVIGARAVGRSSLIKNVSLIDPTVQAVEPQLAIFSLEEPRALLHEASQAEAEEQLQLKVGSQTVAVVMQPHSYRRMFTSRFGPDDSAKREQALRESIDETERLLQSAGETLWIENRYNQPEYAAHQLLRVVDGTYTDSVGFMDETTGKAFAKVMLTSIRSLG